MAVGTSSIATQVQGRTTRIVKRTPCGTWYQSTGPGVTELALYERKKNKQTGKKQLVKRATPLRPIDVALRSYLASQNGANKYPWGGPGYVIDLGGTIYQIADDITRAGGRGSL